MIKLIDVAPEGDRNEYAGVVRVVVKNRPSKSKHRALVESALQLNEGKEKEWRDGYTYRLDRRPAHQGGDQLHIFNRTGGWAYRHTGDRSETNKYTLPATNTVKDIVAHVFGVPRDIVEANVASAGKTEIVLEVSFA